MTSWDDLRAQAQRRLPRFLFDYIDGGAISESTMRRNRSDLDRIGVRQRVLADDISNIEIGRTLLGERLDMPVVVGPVGLSGMYARRGEVQGRRAAERAGIPFCLSTVSVCSLSEVAQGARAAPWFQLYVMRDRGFMRELIEQARSLDVRTLVFTVDMPMPGIRHRDARSGMSGPGAAVRRFAQALGRPGWAFDVGLLGRPHTLGNIAPALGGRAGLADFMGWMGANFDPSIRWRDLEEIRALWDGNLVLKGVLDPRDARLAADLGVDGLVVSNHGGRQLDGAPSTVQVLPHIAEAVGERLTVMADSGVRSGLDVVRMLAMGAQAVWLGRLWAYALAAGGEPAVSAMLATLKREIQVTMGLAGCRDLSRLSPEMLCELSAERSAEV